MAKNVPKIRFKEFTDEWEQRKLKEVLVQRTSQIAENDEYRLMSFVKDVGVVPKNERYDRSFLVKDEKKKYKITELGDFIYSSNNLESGSIGINKTGKALISPVYSVFSSKFGNSSVFIGLESKRKEFLNQMIRYRQGVTYGQWRIHEYDFLNLRLAIPNDDEQRKIIIFFERLDNLITLHQRKLNLLESQKKSLLQKMFPKNGDVKPELRFANFTDDWEQRKFDSLVKRVAKTSEENLPSVEYDDVISGYGKLNKNVALKENNRKGILFQEDDILFGKLRPYLKNWLIANFKGIAIGDWWVFRSNINSQFTYTLIQTKQYETISNLSTGTKMPRSDWKIVANSEFRVPISNVEQAKVGTLFKKLDNLITLHQSELSMLQEQKKGLLQKMFV